MKDLEKALNTLMEEAAKLDGESSSLDIDEEEKDIDQQILEINRLLKGE